MTQLAEAGARRLSVGGALARVAVTALVRAGEKMRDQGSFAWTAGLASSAEVKKLLGVGPA